MKIAVVGSREYPNLIRVREFIEKLPENAVIVSGGKVGVDFVVYTTALALGRRTKVFRPTGFNGRNGTNLADQKIVDYADEVYIFWNGDPDPKLTAFREEAKRLGKLKKVYRPSSNIVTHTIGETNELRNTTRQTDTDPDVQQLREAAEGDTQGARALDGSAV